MTPLLFGVAAAAGLLLSAGCREKASLLVDAKTRRDFEARILRAVEANKGKTCARPVLRGDAQEGDGTSSAVALVEGSAETRACLKLLDARSTNLQAALFVPAKERPMGYPDRRVSRPFKVGEPGEKVVAAVARACGPVVKRLRMAVRHRHGCSPYLPGLRCTPNWLGVIRAAEAIAASARHLLIHGKVREGVDLLLDLLRFSQDLERGGTSWLVVSIASGVASIAVPLLERAFNQNTGFTTPQLDHWDRQLSVLLNSEPHPSTSVRGEYQSVTLETVLPQFAGQGWKPPGTGCVVKMEAPRTSRRERYSVAAWQDVWALHALVYEQIAKDMGLVCPSSASPMFCDQALTRLAERYKRQGASAFARLQSRLTSAKAQRRDPGLPALLELPGVNARYLRIQSRRRVSIAGLCLSVSYRRLAEESGKCPARAAFDAAPLKSRRHDPYSGGQLLVRQSIPGRFVVSSPELTEAAGLDKAPAVVVSCQPKTSPNPAPLPGMTAPPGVDPRPAVPRPAKPAASPSSAKH
ncbi:MAG: hypothetical protein ABI333_15940 [bacterium]